MADEQDIEEQAATEEQEQRAAHAQAQADPDYEEPLIKIMLQPTTCSVMKFENGRRLISITQQGVEVSIPLGPGEAEQLSQELHVSQVASVSPAEARAAGLHLPS